MLRSIVTGGGTPETLVTKHQNSGPTCEVSLDEIRVLLINLRGVLGDVIRTVLRNSADLSIVADRADAVDARPLLDGVGVDVIVCSLDDASATDIATTLFEPYLRTKVIAVRDDGRQAILWELHPRRSLLGDLSPRLLVDTVRKAGGP
jgi:hypothetical protein